MAEAIGGRADGGLETVGEGPDWPPKLAPVGEGATDGGVGRVRGDTVGCGKPCAGVDIAAAPGSSLGAMLEADRRDWCLFKMARWIGGGCTIFWGM